MERGPDGILVVINPDCEEPATCATCHGHGSCMKSARPTACTVGADEDSGVQPGDKVRIVHFVFNQALAALLVFGSPLLFALGGTLVVHAITGSGMDSPLSIASAGVGFALGFFFCSAADRAARRLAPTPHLVSTIEEGSESVRVSPPNTLQEDVS